MLAWLIALVGLLGQQVEVTMGSADGATLVASVRAAQATMLGAEGFRIAHVDGVVSVEAASSSALSATISASAALRFFSSRAISPWSDVARF